MSNIIENIRNFFRVEYLLNKAINDPNSEIQQQLKSINSRIVAEKLKAFAVHSNEPGVSSERLCDHEVVVSLTSYGQRIHEVWLTIESIMQGTVLPNHIVLWLGENEKNNILPVALQRQQKRGLEIMYCEDIRSYKKLIPSLRKYPEACIITIDDDLIYEPDIIENLINSYIKFPNAVSACRIHKIKTAHGGKVCPYMSWEHFKFDSKPSFENFLTSGGGTLFPPNSFSDEVFNKDVFMDICRYADDVWFQAMLILNGTKVKKAFTHSAKGQDYITHDSEYDEGLFSINITRNDEQIRAVFDKYNLYEKLR